MAKHESVDHQHFLSLLNGLNVSLLLSVSNTMTSNYGYQLVCSPKGGCQAAIPSDSFPFMWSLECIKSFDVIIYWLLAIFPVSLGKATT